MPNPSFAYILRKERIRNLQVFEQKHLLFLLLLIFHSCWNEKTVVHAVENETIELSNQVRTERDDIFLFFRPSLNGLLFPMFCLLVEGECQILVF